MQILGLLGMYFFWTLFFNKIFDYEFVVIDRLFSFFKDKLSMITLTFRFSKSLEYFGVKWVLLSGIVL